MPSTCSASQMACYGSIDEVFDPAFPHEDLAEILKVASGVTGSFHVAALSWIQ